MNFHKLLPLFTKCCVVYLNIPVGQNHIVCISHFWITVNIQLGFKFLISVPNNFSTNQYTVTFYSYIVPTMKYSYYTILDCYTLFMLLQFQSQAACKLIKLELTTAYHSQTDSQLQIMNKKIIQVIKACKAKGNKQLSKILEIHLKLNMSCNAFRRINPFVSVLGFNTKLELHTFRYLINNNQPAIEHYNATS